MNLASRNLSTSEALSLLQKWKEAAFDEEQRDPMKICEKYDAAASTKFLDHYSYLGCNWKSPSQQELGWEVIKTLTKASSTADRAVGSMYGLVLGDSFGLPYEFLDPEAAAVPPIRENGPSHNPASSSHHQEISPIQKMKSYFENSWFSTFWGASKNRYAFLDKPKIDASNGEENIEILGKSCRYTSDLELQHGQWSDDTSMALCLADSLLANKGFHGGDCRIRFFNWMGNGLNNCFRYDFGRQSSRCSFGLGSNIDTSLNEFSDEASVGKAKDEVASEFIPHYEEDKENSGNGSMMRLAPVIFRYLPSSSSSVGEFHNVMEMAGKSSRTTHPGRDAEACCRFMAFFTSKAILRSIEQDNNKNSALQQFLSETVQEFVDFPHLPLRCNEKQFLLDEKGAKTTVENIYGFGIPKLKQLLLCNPPSEKEAVWRWKMPRLALDESIHARGMLYNGKSVTPCYFGSYCMDGLAMSLWSMWQKIDSSSSSSTKNTSNRGNDMQLERTEHREESFNCALERVINLRGDSDTTGAIAGSMIGAYYGFHSILSHPAGKVMLRDVRRWDPYCEIGLKTLMLLEDNNGTLSKEILKKINSHK